VRHWEELIDFMDENEGRKEPYINTSMAKCTLEQDKLDDQYMGLYTNGQKIMDPIYGQILYNCCLSIAFKLKFQHNSKIFLVEIKRATEKDIAKDVIRPRTFIPGSRVMARCVQLLIIINGHWKVLKRVEERWEWRMVGRRMIVVLM
jgi:hypothetical protein